MVELVNRLSHFGPAQFETQMLFTISNLSTVFCRGGGQVHRPLGRLLQITDAWGSSENHIHLHLSFGSIRLRWLSADGHEFHAFNVERLAITDESPRGSARDRLFAI